MALKASRSGVRKDQVDFYGRVKQSGGGASIEDFINSDDIKFSKDETTNKIKAELVNLLKEKIENALNENDIQDSNEIVFDIDEETDKLFAVLAQEISNKINNSLQAPLTSPSSSELVGIDTNKAQQRIVIGNGLKINNNSLELDKKIKTTMDSVAIVNTQYYLGTVSSVTFTLPTGSLGDEIVVVFYSGSTATTLSITGNTIGDIPTPNANERVELNLLYDGTHWCILSSVIGVE